MPRSDDDLTPPDHKPVTREDVDEANPRMIANQLRTLQRDVRSGFELLGQRILTAIERVNDKLDDQAARISDLERRVAALETPKRASRPRKKK